RPGASLAARCLLLASPFPQGRRANPGRSHGETGRPNPALDWTTVTAASPAPERRRSRPGSLERPINARLYRGTWLLVGLPLLLLAFSVARPAALTLPDLPPAFNAATAAAIAGDLATNYPDRLPGSPGAAGASRWVADQLAPFG